MQRIPVRVRRFVAVAFVVLTSLAALLASPLPARTASNPIQAENALPGNDTWWLQNPSNDTTGQIKGYAGATSVAQGGSLSLYVSVNPAQTYTMDVYRVGYYGGKLARLVQHIGPLSGTKQAACPTDASTGLIVCNWSTSYTLNPTASWTSGVYIVRLINAQGYDNYMTFVVRDGRAAAFTYQQAATTFEAYNNYPGGSTGKSLYEYNSGSTNTVAGTPRAVRVSFDRPYSGTGDGLFLEWEVHFVHWMEKMGYDATYITDVDTHANGGVLLNGRGFLSVGHDEYWSKPMYDAAVAARDAGVNLGFFGANAVYWQIRLDPSAGNVANRIITCYKDASKDPIQGATTTVKWRDPPVNRPEQGLVGVMFTSMRDYGNNIDYVVTNASNSLYNGTGFSNGSKVTKLVGYEMDRYWSNYPAPANLSRTLLSQSPYSNVDGVADVQNTSIYQAPSKAWVFGAGTMSWSEGLEAAYPVPAASPGIQRMTQNILDLFASSAPVPPAIPQAPTGLTATPVSSSQINLGWTASSGATSYKIQRSPDGSTGWTQIGTSSSTAYSDTGLSAATAYSYRVLASNSSGDSGPSNVASATTSQAVPAAPTGLTAAPGSSTQINLGWTASSGASSYKIQRSADGTSGWAQVGTSTATGYSDTGLSPATTYYYRVLASNGAGDSAPSGMASATTAQVPPAAPTGLSATAVAPSQINLAWTAASGASSYKIQRSLDSSTWSQVGTSTTTSYIDLGLNASTTYYYQVLANNTAGDSGPSNVAFATTLQPPPAAPTGLSATAFSPTQVNLGWTASGGASSYKIQRSPNGTSGWTQVGTSATTAFSDTGLAPSTTYYYQVLASNSSGDSGASNLASATTPQAPPVAPTGLTASGVSSSQINLGWNAVAGATGYKIQRSPDGSTGWTQVGTSTAAAYMDMGLTASTTYYYQVLASNSAGDSGASNVAFATTLQPAPAAPTGLTATAMSPSQINLSWTASSGATSYKIQRSPDGSTGWTQVGTSTTTGYSNTGLSPATTYYYQVLASNSTGDSGPSTGASATTPVGAPAAPTGLTAGAVSPTQINLSWTASSGATSYKIQRSPNGSTGWSQVGTSTAAAYMDTGLNPSTTYYYQVLASNATGDSGPSNLASASTPVAAPAAPTGLTATAFSASQINLGWTASGGATSYKIQRSPDGTSGWTQVGTSTTTSFSNTGLSPSTTYYYRVLASNATGDSGPSTVASAATPAGAPGAPTGLTASAVSTSQVNLGWNAVSGATSYKVQRSPNGSSGWTQVGTSTAAAYMDMALAASTTYYYRVLASNGSGDSGPSNTASATTPQAAPPAPTGLTATAASSWQINLSWTASAGATSYKIQRSPNGSTGWAQVGTSTATSTKDTSLSPSTTYYYRVLASNATSDSGPSNVASATTAAAPLWSAAYTTDSTPTTWSPNQTQTYNVTVTNNGTSAWTAGGTAPVHLAAHFVDANTDWTTDQRFALPADLLPGQSVTLTIAVTGPDPGTSSFMIEYQMVKETQFWFDQYNRVNVTVTG
ncbi:MAG: N,N-dimethylformamidase beta subunit family domain-containing protein [Candidatus Dormiibacterota bacterium]